MINAKLTKAASQNSNEERLFKVLESIDWKLWEIYNMMKDNLPAKAEDDTKTKPAAKKTTKKTTE
jgi:hypothetical protein